jgi:hypothetical protein
MITHGLEKHQIKYRYTCIYTCNIVERSYRDIDMTVERNGNIMDNSVVTPRNIRDKIVECQNRSTNIKIMCLKLMFVIFKAPFSCMFQ